MILYKKDKDRKDKNKAKDKESSLTKATPKKSTKIKSRYTLHESTS